MKKIIGSSVLMASIFVLIGKLNAFQNIDSINREKTPTTYAAKYDDCLLKSDFPKDCLKKSKMVFPKTDRDFNQVNTCVKKYKQSLDTTIKNLNYIDAHNFLHSEFKKSKLALEDNDLSNIRLYYHLEIMKVCHEKDSSLNLNLEHNL